MVLQASLAGPPAVLETEPMRRRDAAHDPHQILDESPIVLLPQAGIRAARRGVETVGRDDLVLAEAEVGAEPRGQGRLAGPPRAR